MGIPKLLILFLFSIAAIGGAVYVITQDDSGVSDGESTDTDTEVSDENAGPVDGTGSFEALLAMGRSLSCDFTQVIEETGGSIAGTVYIDGGYDARFRADFEMEQAGESYESHMIMREGTMYTWTISSQGTFATRFDPEENDTDVDGDTSATAGANSDISLEEELTYQCRPWAVDNARFELPSGIEFQSMEERMQQSVSGSADCSVCANIADASAQSQCKIALGCSQ